MARARALMNFPYDGRDYREGDELDVHDKDVEILTLAGRIGPADETPRRRRGYNRRDQRAEE